MLDTTSNHPWQLDARSRFRGAPTKQATVWKNTFKAVLVPLAKLLSGTNRIDAKCRRSIAEMLDPKSEHELQLDFKQRKRGRPPLELSSKYRPVHVPAPTENHPAMLLARRAERIRGANKTGTKVPLKQLHDGSSLSTLKRRLKTLRERNKTAVRLKSRSPK
jgi:hypothetical protein